MVRSAIPTPTTTLGARLQELRIEAGLSEVDLAYEIGYDYSGSARVREYESGGRVPTLMLLKRIADAYEITVAQLLDGVI